MDFRRFLQTGALILVAFILVRFSFPFVIRTFSTPLAFFHRIGVYVRDLLRFPELYHEYLSLKQQSLDLGFYRYYTSALKEENQRLRDLLNMPPQKGFKKVIADVLIQPHDDISFFYINRGTADGVRTGFGVMAPGYVMAGRVIETWDHVSKVAYPWNIGCSATVIDENSREEGILVGDGRNLWMRFLSSISQVQKGDVIRTSKLSLFFPPGLLVGEVKTFSCQKGYVECRAEVIPCIKGMSFYQAIVLIPTSGWIKKLELE